MELILGYLAGIFTLINPCVLPVLPVVLGSAVQSNKYGPLALAAGLSVSFVALGMFLAVFGLAIGVTYILMSQIGAAMMIGFGFILLVPGFAVRFEMATAGIASQADHKIGEIEGPGLKSQFLGGVLLGAAWTPCVGPTLGGAIALASQGQSLSWSALIMTSFSLGVSTIIIALGYGTRKVIKQRQTQLRIFARSARPIMGGLFILIGAMILFGFNNVAGSWLLDTIPIWLQDISVMF